MANAVAVYDFTLPKDELTHNDVIKALYPGIVKKYSFQSEIGDSGYEHYQGRISLIKKRRGCEALKLLRTKLAKIYISPTSNNGMEEEFYVLKEDTRVLGPWTDKDEVTYIPRQVREMTTLRPWQQSVIDMHDVWDTRKIHVIIDTSGNIGKSSLCSYMGCHRMARTLPFVNDYKDIMRMVCDMPTSRCYIIDMPRAISKEKLFQMYAGIETIKSGYAYDDRYHFKDKYFDCPNVWVFTNKVPDETLLSPDRWCFHTISEEGVLGDYVCNNENPEHMLL